MNSFYGGKAGAPFIIVCSYKSVQEMANAFAQGVRYTGVQFDEYVIINTVNKNDPDNGRVYRRGYNLSLLEDNPRKNDAPVNGKKPPQERQTGGGEYVGTIVGPAGHAPRVIFTTVDEVKAQRNEWNEETWDARGKDVTYNVGNKHIYPGKYVEGGVEKFNDDVKWSYLSIRDKNNEDTNLYIGFKFPYTVIDYTAQTVNPYYNRSNNTASFVNQNLTTRTDDGSHPFYEKWSIKVPKGIKGDTFKNFRLIKTSTDLNAVQSYDGKTSDTAGINNTASKPRQIFAYDYYHYDKLEGGEPVTLYLGDYNTISDIRFADDGSFEIDYTHENTDVWTKKVNWIKSVSLNSSNGIFKVVYNNNTVSGANADNNQAYQAQLKWVKSAKITDNGSLELSYTTGDTETTSNNKIKWITGITMDDKGTITVKYNNGSSNTVISNAFTSVAGATLSDKGQFQMTFNNSTVPPLNKRLTWMTGATLSDTGLLQVNFNNDGIPNIEKQLKWITDVTLSDDGTLEFIFCDGTKKTFSKKVKWINNIKINSGDSENQKISIQYDNSTAWNDVGNPINYIEEVAVRPKDAMLLVRYADPTKRGDITYDSKDGWTALQSVRDYSGWLNGIVLNSDNYVGIESDEGAKTFLDSRYPNGLEGINVATKTVAIQRPGMRTAIFAFDYNNAENRKWQKLGQIETEAPQMFCAQDDDSQALAQKKKELDVGGVWFVEEID